MSCNVLPGRLLENLSCNFSSLVTFNDAENAEIPAFLQPEVLTQVDGEEMILRLSEVVIRDGGAYKVAISGISPVSRVAPMFWIYAFAVNAATQNTGSVLRFKQETRRGLLRVSPVLYLNDALIVTLQWLVLVGIERLSPRFAASLILKQRFLDDHGETNIKSLHALQDQRTLRWVSFGLGVLPIFAILCGSRGIVPAQIVGVSYVVSWMIFELLSCAFTFHAPISWYDRNDTLFPRLKRWHIAKWYALFSVLSATTVSCIPIAYLLVPFLTVPLRQHAQSDFLSSAIAFSSGVVVFATSVLLMIWVHLLTFKKELESVYSSQLNSVLERWEGGTIGGMVLMAFATLSMSLLMLPHLRSQAGLDPYQRAMLWTMRFILAWFSFCLLLSILSRVFWRWWPTVEALKQEKSCTFPSFGF